jgi:2-keto-3-deoxy-L-fuconate dehydrogenase
LTAAGRGIGRATALAFAREGAQVLATDIDANTLSDLRAADGRIVTLPLDATNGGALVELAAAHPHTDILFNCAGWVHHGTVLDCTREDWDRSFALNVTSMYAAIRAFLPAMLAKGSGAILNVSSVVSSIKGAPNRFAYGATKAAVIGLTKAVAADFVGQGVRCNAICPGTVETPSLHDRIAAQPDPEAARRAFIARQPMGRFGQPEEVAALAVYLASDEAAFVTGGVHVVDGGMSL